MAFVLTVDQRASRSSPDRVPEVLRRLNAAVPTVLGFERTAGDEFQGVLADPDDVLEVVLQLVRTGEWSIGIGAGPVHTPLPPAPVPAPGRPSSVPAGPSTPPSSGPRGWPSAVWCPSTPVTRRRS